MSERPPSLPCKDAPTHDRSARHRQADGPEDGDRDEQQPDRVRRLAVSEAGLGARLFECLPAGYVATAAGEAMVGDLAGVDAAIHDAGRRAAGHDRRITGSVRLAATDTLPASVLPDALARVRAA